MPLIVHYPTKAAAKEAIGTKLKYTDPSKFMGYPQYDANGRQVVINRPSITKMGQEWMGLITCHNGIITKVE